MKTALVIYVIYESVFFKNAHSALDVQVFDTPKQCQLIKKEVVKTIKDNTKKIDKVIARCIKMPQEWPIREVD